MGGFTGDRCLERRAQGFSACIEIATADSEHNFGTECSQSRPDHQREARERRANLPGTNRYGTGGRCVEQIGAGRCHLRAGGNFLTPGLDCAKCGFAVV